WEGATTIAAGLRVPAAVADFLVLRILRASGGTAVTVSDAEMRAGIGELASAEGIFACQRAPPHLPASGASETPAGSGRKSGWSSSTPAAPTNTSSSATATCRPRRDWPGVSSCQNRLIGGDPSQARRALRGARPVHLGALQDLAHLSF